MEEFKECANETKLKYARTHLKWIYFFKNQYNLNIRKLENLKSCKHICFNILLHCY